MFDFKIFKNGFFVLAIGIVLMLIGVSGTDDVIQDFHMLLPGVLIILLGIRIIVTGKKEDRE